MSIEETYKSEDEYEATSYRYAKIEPSQEYEPDEVVINVLDSFNLRLVSEMKLSLNTNEYHNIYNILSSYSELMNGFVETEVFVKEEIFDLIINLAFLDNESKYQDLLCNVLCRLLVLSKYAQETFYANWYQYISLMAQNNQDLMLELFTTYGSISDGNKANLNSSQIDFFNVFTFDDENYQRITNFLKLLTLLDYSPSSENTFDKIVSILPIDINYYDRSTQGIEEFITLFFQVATKQEHFIISDNKLFSFFLHEEFTHEYIKPMLPLCDLLSKKILNSIDIFLPQSFIGKIFCLDDIEITAQFIKYFLEIIEIPSSYILYFQYIDLANILVSQFLKKQVGLKELYYQLLFKFLNICQEHYFCFFITNNHSNIVNTINYICDMELFDNVFVYFLMRLTHVPNLENETHLIIESINKNALLSQLRENDDDVDQEMFEEFMKTDLYKILFQ